MNAKQIREYARKEFIQRLKEKIKFCDKEIKEFQNCIDTLSRVKKKAEHLLELAEKDKK